MSDTFWWVVVLIIIVLGVAGHFYVYKRYHYICPECSDSFKPTFIRSLTAVNAAEERRMKCPHCGHIAFMRAIKDGRGME